MVPLIMSLADERYINLESFKRDGTGVRTPVWVAPLEGALVIFTLVESFKVRRIARDPRVRVAACDVRGKLRGPWHEGRCVRVEDPELERRAYAALRRKYGLQMRLGDVLSRLSGRMKRRIVMKITLQEPAPRG